MIGHSKMKKIINKAVDIVAKEMGLFIFLIVMLIFYTIMPRS